MCNIDDALKSFEKAVYATENIDALKEAEWQVFKDALSAFYFARKARRDASDNINPRLKPISVNKLRKKVQDANAVFNQLKPSKEPLIMRLTGTYHLFYQNCVSKYL